MNGRTAYEPCGWMCITLPESSSHQVEHHTTMYFARQKYLFDREEEQNDVVAMGTTPSCTCGFVGECGRMSSTEKLGRPLGLK